MLEFGVVLFCLCVILTNVKTQTLSGGQKQDTDYTQQMTASLYKVPKHADLPEQCDLKLPLQ